MGWTPLSQKPVSGLTYISCVCEHVCKQESKFVLEFVCESDDSTFSSLTLYQSAKSCSSFSSCVMLDRVWACALAAPSPIEQNIKTTAKPTAMWFQSIQETPGLFFNRVFFTHSNTSGQCFDILGRVQRNYIWMWSGPRLTAYFWEREHKGCENGLVCVAEAPLVSLWDKCKRPVTFSPGTHVLFISGLVGTVGSASVS